MKPTSLRRLLTAVSLMAVTVAAGACAEERAPLNHVQPNVLDKTFFVGDIADQNDNPSFYARAFVVDQAVNQAELSVGLYSGTDKIKWEITEDYLIAHKAYQLAYGQDNHGLPNGPPNGIVVAKYRIQNHFDIKRSYNPQTGEELNVIEENGSDRPWQQRKFFRVDWSTNDVLDPEWGEIFLGKIFGDMELLPLTYSITDPTSDDAPHFETADGYFDVTNRYYVAPKNTYFAQWDITLPTCALIGVFTGTITSNCDAQEATVRHSFWKIDPNHDYEPQENTKRGSDVFANFGGVGSSFQPGFASGTQCWDPQYAYTDACFHTYMSKHNFWVQSHTPTGAVAARAAGCAEGSACDPAVTLRLQGECETVADDNSNGTADQCEIYSGSHGSQCDLSGIGRGENGHLGKDGVQRYFGRCTLPLRDRSIKTVGYWHNKETPATLLDAIGKDKNPVGATDSDGQPKVRGALERVTQSWNQLLMAALAYGREAECKRTGDGTREACHAQFFELSNNADVIQMIDFGAWGIPTPKHLEGDAGRALTSCHAPVRPYDDHTTCGPEGEVARNGDQRKNFIFYWPYDSDAGYGGVAGLGADQQTGEEHGATATVMGRSATRAAAVYRDYIQFAMGDMSLSDITGGVPQEVYAKLMQNGFSPDSDYAKRRRGEAPTYRPQEPAAPAPKYGVGAFESIPQQRAATKAIEEMVRGSRRLAIDPTVQASAQAQFDALASRLRGTEYEAQLVDSSFVMATTGADPTAPVDAAALDAASPLRKLDSGKLALWRAQMAGTLANHGVCYTDDVPRIGSINFQGLSRYYQDIFDQKGITDVKERGEFIYQDLIQGMATGIAIHEVGHCLGMRHNFASSWDAPNYMPQYWQLRTREGADVNQTCTSPRDPAKADSCMGPRYFDPESEDEMGLTKDNGRPGVGYFGNTSVMEYEQDYMSPGIGTYDFGYVKALYGGVLETFDTDASHVGSIAPNEQHQFAGNLAAQRIELSFLSGGVISYTDLAMKLKVFDPKYCRAATDDEKARGTWRIVHGKICTQSPRDHHMWGEMIDDGADGTPLPAGGFDQVTSWKTRNDKNGNAHYRWNYRYGETYGTGYFHTNYSDNGADVYEVTTNTAKMFDVTYPLSYFRKQNKEFTPLIGLPSAVADKFFERMRSYHSTLELNDGYLSQAAPPELYKGYQLASQETFYLLAHAAMAPEPGPQSYFRRPDGSSLYDIGGPFGGDLEVSVIEGRYGSEEFDSNLGGEWDYQSWVQHAGYTVERGLAMRALVDGRPNLSSISRETAIDGRNIYSNYRSNFARPVDRLIGGLLSEDWPTVAPWVLPSATGIADVQYLNLIDPSPSSPATSAPIFPNFAYKGQLWTVIFTQLFSRLSTDMTMVNKMRIYVDGLDFLSALPDSEQARFTFPESGMTYVARRYGNDSVNGHAIDAGIASRMLAHANAIIELAYPVERQSGNAVHDQYGAPHVLSSAPTDDIAADALRKYVGLIDATRQVGRLLDGPLGPDRPDQ